VIQARTVEGIQAPRAGGPHRRESALAQHAQVTRHGRLRQAELALDRSGHVSCGLFARREQLEDSPPHRVSEDSECLHGAVYLHLALYTSRLK
jgi:hypothetical protein